MGQGKRIDAATREAIRRLCAVLTREKPYLARLAEALRRERRDAPSERSLRKFVRAEGIPPLNPGRPKRAKE